MRRDCNNEIERNDESFVSFKNNIGYNVHNVQLIDELQITHAICKLLMAYIQWIAYLSRNILLIGELHITSVICSSLLSFQWVSYRMCMMIYILCAWYVTHKVHFKSVFPIIPSFISLITKCISFLLMVQYHHLKPKISLRANMQFLEV